MTRFKELARIERAIESPHEAELRWAEEYCLMRIRIAPNSASERPWKNRLKQVRAAREKIAP